VRAALLLVIALLSACESGARREGPIAAAPDASAAQPAVASATTSPALRPPAPAIPTSTPSTAPAPGERPCVTALIGDSLTEERVGGGYIRYLRERSPRSRFVNYAKGGAMVNQMKRQLDAMLAGADGPFTHLVVFGGVNDLYSDETAGRTVAKIEADLEDLYAAGRERGLRIVGITVAPWGGFNKYYNERRGATTRELNRWILEGATRGDLDAAVDAYALLSCGVPTHLCRRYAMEKSDGLHFGKLGHEALGAALYEAEFHRCP
jgi:lysophospholipase L1-like esterase